MQGAWKGYCWCAAALNLYLTQAEACGAKPRPRPHGRREQLFILSLFAFLPLLGKVHGESTAALHNPHTWLHVIQVSPLVPCPTQKQCSTTLKCLETNSPCVCSRSSPSCVIVDGVGVCKVRGKISPLLGKADAIELCAGSRSCRKLCCGPNNPPPTTMPLKVFSEAPLPGPSMRWAYFPAPFPQLSTALLLCPVQLKCANGRHDDGNNELGTGGVDCDSQCQTCSSTGGGTCANKTHTTTCKIGTETGLCTDGVCVVSYRRVWHHIDAHVGARQGSGSFPSGCVGV